MIVVRFEEIMDWRRRTGVQAADVWHLTNWQISQKAHLWVSGYSHHTLNFSNFSSLNLVWKEAVYHFDTGDSHVSKHLEKSRLLLVHCWILCRLPLRWKPYNLLPCAGCLSTSELHSPSPSVISFFFYWFPKKPQSHMTSLPWFNNTQPRHQRDIRHDNHDFSLNTQTNHPFMQVLEINSTLYI